MTATDELRKLLDKCGIKHFDYEKHGRTQTQWEAPDGKRHFTYETYDNLAKTANIVIAWLTTPEQAIAATMGGQPARLTAEQVRKAMKKYAHDDSCYIFEVYGEMCGAIADELNATLGRGTCKPTEEDCCPICGEDLVKCNVGIGELGGAVELDPPIYHNYCPNCGAKIRKVVEQ